MKKTTKQINVDKILNDIRKNKRLQKLNKEFNDEIELHLISTNYTPKKKTNYYKILNLVIMTLSYLALASTISLYAVLWII